MFRAATYSRYGTPDAVSVSAQADQEMAADALRIRVKAAGVNPLDWKLLRGDMRWLRRGAWPRFLGCDFAGEIEAAGSAVTGWRIGQRVFGSLRDPLAGRRGAFAEALVVSPTEIAPVPEGVALALAGVLPIAGASAWQCLEQAGVGAGSDVLIVGASGGVGSFATALAVARGARVTAVCSSGNEAYARQLGAQAVLAYDRVDPLAGDGRYDVILDASSSHDFSRCAPLLKPEGRYVLTAPGAAHYLAMWRSRLFGGKRALALMVRIDATVLGMLAQQARAGVFGAVALARFALDEIRTALELSRSGRARGKIVIEPGAAAGG